MHAAIVLLVLVLTYLGMAAGRIAWLRVDRTGIALLAVIALLASSQMTLDDFGSAVDMPTLALLFAMMIISAQFAESGFIDLCARTIISTRGGTAILLALTVAIGGGLSAVLANDILIIAIAPLLIAGAQSRGFDPRPFAIALAAATNAGSAATMIAAVDWPLLLLVSCLFAITGALNQAGIAAKLLAALETHGLLPDNLLLLTPFAVVTSNAFGSVPPAMLLLQVWPTPPANVLYGLAVLSTLAGNLLLTGSLTNLLIAERAGRMGAPLSFRDHARAGIPITAISLAFAVAW